MRRLTLIILALATLLPSLAQAYDMLILQSSHNAGYEEACKVISSVNKASQQVVVLSDYAEVDAVRIVREDRPRVVLAIGNAAIAATAKIQRTPVIAVMALGADSRANVAGITVFAEPKYYCELLQQMKVKRIGIIHNPNKTGWYLAKARVAAEKAGIKLEVRKVETAREAVTQLSSLAGKVDALWILPDSTAVTRETTEAFFQFGQQQAVPVISFASIHLGMGAAAVVDLNYSAIGRQAADMAAKLLDGADVSSMSFDAPAQPQVKTNRNVLTRLGLTH